MTRLFIATYKVKTLNHTIHTAYVLTLRLNGFIGSAASFLRSVEQAGVGVD